LAAMSHPNQRTRRNAQKGTTGRPRTVAQVVTYGSSVTGQVPTLCAQKRYVVVWIVSRVLVHRLKIQVQSLPGSKDPP